MLTTACSDVDCRQLYQHLEIVGMGENSITMRSAKPAKRRMSKNERQENLTGWLMALPFVLGLIFWTLGPMFYSVYLSFTDWDLLTTANWVGLDNYKVMFDTPETWIALKVTTVFALGSIPLIMIAGLCVALLLNTKVRGLSFWRAIYYLPAVLSGVAVALLWRLIFSADFGLLNYLLGLIGISGPPWLNSETWALPALVVMSLWAVGGDMVIYLAALQGVPTELYEAAEVDGANTLQRFFKITLPMISPVLLFQLIVGIIAALQTFTQAYIMTRGGPNNSTLFFVLYLYRSAFQYFKMGYASALAWLLFVYILILTLLIFRSSALWVFYSGEIKGK
jgi:multiple sugar transport system permease protein